MAKKPKNIKYKEARHNHLSIAFSDRELDAIDEYCRLFNKPTRAAVIREGAVRFVRQYIIDRKTNLFPEYDDPMQHVEESTTPYNSTPTAERPAAVDLTPSLFDNSDLQ